MPVSLLGLTVISSAKIRHVATFDSDALLVALVDEYAIHLAGYPCFPLPAEPQLLLNDRIAELRSIQFLINIRQMGLVSHTNGSLFVL